MTRTSDWPRRRLGDIASMRSGGTPAAGNARFFGGGIPWVSIGDMTGSGRFVANTARTLSQEGLASSAATLYPAGAVLYAMYASLGECSIAVGRVASSQAILGITPGPAVDRDFLYYFLSSIKSTVRAMGQHGTQANLNAEMVRDFRVPLPDILEQRRIASVLNDAYDSIDAIERLITKKQAIKQGVMQQLLTGRTRLPGFTRPWIDQHLGDHVRYVKTVPLSRAQLDSTSPLRYLHYGDIHTTTAIRLPAATEPMPRAAFNLVDAAGRLQVGDLVFADASEDLDGVGKSVEISSVPADGVVAGLHTIAARFDKRVLSDGFKAYLQFMPAFRGHLLRLAAGTKVLATTRTYISSVTLSLPSVDEQQAIVEVLQDVDGEIVALYERLAKARSIRQGMVQALLSASTRLPSAEHAL